MGSRRGYEMGRWAGVRMGRWRRCEMAGGGANGEMGGVRKGRWAGPLPAEDACNMKKQKDGIASPSSKEFCFSRSYVYETGRPLSAQACFLKGNFFYLSIITENIPLFD